MSDANPQEEITVIKLAEVLAICRISKASVYKAINKGNFPAPVKLVGRCSGWVLSEVQQWLRSRMGARAEGGAAQADRAAARGVAGRPGDLPARQFIAGRTKPAREAMTNPAAREKRKGGDRPGNGGAV